MSHGKSETSLLQTQVKDQMNRLITQLQVKFVPSLCTLFNFIAAPRIWRTFAPSLMTTNTKKPGKIR